MTFVGGCSPPEARPADLPGGADLLGVWKVEAFGEDPPQRVHFMPDGNFQVNEGPDGRINYDGKWTVEEGERLLVAYGEREEDCPLVLGAYQFVVDEDRIELTESLDECRRRRDRWVQGLSREETAAERME